MVCNATIDFDEALSILRAEANPIGIESTRLAKAGRRVLAEPVNARIDVPRYDAAAMDGYAIRSECEPSEQFRLVGSSYPGAPWTGDLNGGETVRIMTGAKLPSGADRVIPFELASECDGRISLPATWSRAEHVRRRGSDIVRGQTVLEPGTILGPRALLCAAAADVGSVRTWRRPSVSVIASGDELVSAGDAASHEHAVPDSLSEAILLLARQHNAKPLGAALVVDEISTIRAAAEAALVDCDVLVMVGGAARGDRDFAKAALGPIGLEIRFADVAMKPGKPVWYGRIGDRHVLGLPGNPTAAMTIARLFLVPLLRAVGGHDFDSTLNWRMMSLHAPVAATGPRESFLCGERVADRVLVIDRQSASDQLLLTRADTLVRLAPNTAELLTEDFVPTLNF